MPDGLGQLARTTSPQPLPDAVCLARFLAGLPDPRGRRGRCFPLAAIVAAASASVLAGARSLTAIAEWIADAPRWVLLALGFAVDPCRDLCVPTGQKRPGAPTGGGGRWRGAAWIAASGREGGVAAGRDGPRRHRPRAAADR
ncbi:transposase family protein [Streptomyces scopuliridis]